MQRPLQLRYHSPGIIFFLPSHLASSNVYEAGHTKVTSLAKKKKNSLRVPFNPPSMLNSKCGLILAKAAALRINLNLDGAPITSQSQTQFKMRTYSSEGNCFEY